MTDTRQMDRQGTQTELKWRAHTQDAGQETAFPGQPACKRQRFGSQDKVLRMAPGISFVCFFKKSDFNFKRPVLQLLPPLSISINSLQSGATSAVTTARPWVCLFGYLYRRQPRKTPPMWLATSRPPPGTMLQRDLLSQAQKNPYLCHPPERHKPKLKKQKKDEGIMKGHSWAEGHHWLSSEMHPGSADHWEGGR